MSKTKLWILVAVFLVLAIAVILWLVLRNRGIDAAGLMEHYDEEDDDPVLLIDYCVKRVATVGGDGYRETVLYQRKDGTCEVHYYSKYEGDAEEAHRGFRVDSGVLEEAYAIINRHRIADWNDRYKGPGLDGAQYILKFRTGDGTYVRSTSDNMPENGLEILAEVEACLDRYVQEENRISSDAD